MVFAYQGFPSLDIDNGFFRAWWIEPMVATISFGVFIHLYWYQERKRGLSRAPLADIFHGPVGDIVYSITGYWVGLMGLRMIVPKQPMPDGIPQNFWEVVYLLAEVVTGVYMYDALFFFIHWMMHDIPALRHIHKKHHDAIHHVLEARDVLRHSLLDGTLQVLCNILVQQRTPWGSPKSRLARVLHNIVVTWMLTESHTCSPEPNIWRRLCIVVREHRLHHFGISTTNSNGSSSYNNYHRLQQFFGYLDNFRAWILSRHDRHGNKLA